jgi:diguanylate cyclase (GGDEF)-like protein
MFRQIALVDPLTGLANRRALFTRLEGMVAEATRTQAEFAVVMTDLDHFKRANDTYGHDFGDEVLAAFAEVLQSQARKGDTVSRYGGEEFVALIGHATADSAMAVAERMRSAWEERTFCPQTEPVSFTASFGVTLWTADGPELAADELLKQADVAMYAAKEQGRNRVVAFTESLQAPAKS